MEKVSEKKIKKLYTKTDIINAIEDIRQKRLTICAASSKYNIFMVSTSWWAIWPHIEQFKHMNTYMCMYVNIHIYVLVDVSYCLFQ